MQQRNYGAVVNFNQHLDADYFCPQSRKSHQNRTAITKVVAINFRGAVFLELTTYFSLEDRSSLNSHKCQQHEITEQENKTSAIKNKAFNLIESVSLNQSRT